MRCSSILTMKLSLLCLVTTNAFQHRRPLRAPAALRGKTRDDGTELSAEAPPQSPMLRGSAVRSTPSMALPTLGGSVSTGFVLLTQGLVLRAVNTKPLIDKTVLATAAALAMVVLKPAAKAELATDGAVRRASGGRAIAQLVGLGVMAVTNSVFGGAAVVFAANVLSRLRRDDDGTPDGTDGNFDGFLMGACVVAATSKPFGQLYKLNGVLVILGMGMSIAGRAPEAWAESAAYLSAAAEAKMAEAKPASSQTENMGGAPVL